MDDFFKAMLGHSPSKDHFENSFLVKTNDNVQLGTSLDEAEQKHPESNPLATPSGSHLSANTTETNSQYPDLQSEKSTDILPNKAQQKFSESISLATSSTSHDTETDKNSQQRQLETENSLTSVSSTKEKRRSKAKSTTSEKIPSLKVGDGWILIDELRLDEETFQTLNIRGKVAHHTVAAILNQRYQEVPCVLNSFGGYVRKFDLRTLRYECRHDSCDREYKIFEMIDRTLIIYRNDVEVSHIDGVKIVRDVRGDERVDAKSKLRNMTAEEYLHECEDEADPSLTKNGNLQKCVSDSTVCKMRSEILQETDYDKDDIIDLLLMKIEQDTNTAAFNYIRRINLDPYLVCLFSDEQMQLLKKFAGISAETVVYFDATGGVVKHGFKKIFYYAGVTPDPTLEVRPNEHRKVLQLFECLSSGHSTFNISLLLLEFKFKFEKQFPNTKWPIVHAVTDFSYAILNAICFSWNTMKLIDYINYVYDALVSNESWTEVRSRTNIVTFIHICCCHLPKNHSKDVQEYFSGLDSDQHNVLKEIFAGMFGIKDIQTLEKIWINFSTLLLSKYMDMNVKNALTVLAEIMTTEEELQIEYECNHNDDDDLIDQYFPTDDESKTYTNDHKTIYENSKFYQSFKKITFVESFATKDDALNCFFSPQYAKMFLQKYITILPLWTCFERFSNAYAEGNFKDSKKRIIRDQNLYGPPPLKAGRLVQLLKKRVEENVKSINMGIPRYRCTGQKSKRSSANGATVNVNDARLSPDANKNKVQPKSSENILLSTLSSSHNSDNILLNEAQQRPSESSSLATSSGSHVSAKVIEKSLQQRDFEIEKSPGISLNKEKRSKVPGRILDAYKITYQKKTKGKKQSITNPSATVSDHKSQQNASEGSSNATAHGSKDTSTSHTIASVAETLSLQNVQTERYHPEQNVEIVDKIVTPSTKRRRDISPGVTPPPLKKYRTPSPSGIDDPNVKESWKRKSKRKFTFFEKKNLNKFRTSPSKLAQLLEKSSRKSSNSMTVKKLPNCLVDHPPTYLAPNTLDFVVAKNSAARLKLHQEDYLTLVYGQTPSMKVIIYILKLFESQHSRIKCELSTDSKQFDFCKKLLNPKISILFFVNAVNESFTLLIVNCKTRKILFIDVQDPNSKEGENCYKAFQKSITNNNAMPQSWELESPNYQLTDQRSNSALCVLKFIELYALYGQTNSPFKPEEYRIELQHRILRQSTSMAKTCIICGDTSDDFDWVQCDCCRRWTHTDCIGRTEEELSDSTLHYFCIICDANAPKPTELDAIAEED